MDDNRNVKPSQIADRLIEYRKFVASAYETGALWMDSLKAKLHPHGFDLVQFMKQRQNFPAKTVRTRGDVQNLYVRMPDGFGKYFSEIRDRGVGIRVCLKVSDIGGARILLPDLGPALLKLPGDGKLTVSGKITGAALAAEYTSPETGRTVPVGTGHSRVQ